MSNGRGSNELVLRKCEGYCLSWIVFLMLWSYEDCWQLDFIEFIIL